MPDYKSMYLHLFNQTTKAIHTLQQAQKETEKMYMESSEANLTLADAKKQGDTP